MFRHVLPFGLLLALAMISGCPFGTGGPTPDPDPDPDPDPTPQEAVYLTREHRMTFTPGGTIDVTVEIDATDGLDVSAMALVEQIPDEWVYLSAEHPLGLLPAIRPQNGTKETLNFVWIQPPPFPYTFTYSLGIPRNTESTANLSGRVEYRVGDGAAEYSDVLESVVTAQ